jgi:hypothetical protein
VRKLVGAADPGASTPTTKLVEAVPKAPAAPRKLVEEVRSAPSKKSGAGELPPKVLVEAQPPKPAASANRP